MEEEICMMRHYACAQVQASVFGKHLLVWLGRLVGQGMRGT